MLPTMEEYIPLVSRLLEHVPEDVVIHRLTGDGPKNLLLAPLWTADKKRVLNAMNLLFDKTAAFGKE
jgi:radical SAM superfamily enzyme